MVNFYIRQEKPGCFCVSNIAPHSTTVKPLRIKVWICGGVTFIFFVSGLKKRLTLKMLSGAGFM